jgi:hypothetical protein
MNATVVERCACSLLKCDLCQSVLTKCDVLAPFHLLMARRLATAGMLIERALCQRGCAPGGISHWTYISFTWLRKVKALGWFEPSQLD